ncbi:MAG: 1-deoxy-D-xylulose-5-phosphate reductoisomerase [Candidatus Riflebacteria bacterium]|nr:1-deoxy-D-xylulose-5-phosphate reductoisomerase [Candidatus Riflebacteria bacterium]
MKKIALLGSTGSIGRSTLEVVRQNPEKLKIVSLTGGKNWQLLAEQAREFRPQFVASAFEEVGNDLRAALADTGIKVATGPEAVLEAVFMSGVNTTVAAIVGAAGLKPVMAAISRGHQVCLANKETLVVGGSLVMEAVARARVDLVPVDSEHSAIFQCLQGAAGTPPRKIIITASGGPFREWPAEKLAGVTLAQALKHPNWNMGGKITIDSATLMNKGLEVIEAHWLFGVSYEQIEVVVHPQSIIHSLIEFSDGSVLAQLGWPDMKLPIQYALSWPDRWQQPLPALDLVKVAQMTFMQPRLADFPCLQLAFSAGHAGGLMPCILNAANEIAVQAFMQQRISFIDIPRVIESTMNSMQNGSVTSIDQLIEVDYETRRRAEELLEARK